MEMVDVLYDEDVNASKIVACPRLCFRAPNGAKRRRLPARKRGLLADKAATPKVLIGPSFSVQSSTKEEAIR